MNKKLFLIDFSSGILIQAAKELKRKGADILYWTGRKRFFEEISKDKKTFPETIFHNSLEAARGIPAPGLDCGEFDPPGAGLIKEMLECESLTLTMMTRLDYTGQMSFLKKKHLYYKYLQYYDGLIQKLKPEMIIFRSVPHAVYNFVLYCLAEKHKIPMLMFDTTIFNDRLLILPGFRQMPKEFFKIYERFNGENHSAKELSLEKQEYFEKLTNPQIDATPYYKKQVIAQMDEALKIIPSWQKILKSIKAGNFLPALRYHLKSVLNLTNRPIFTIDEENKIDYRNIYQLRKIKKIMDRYKAEYRECQREIDWNKKFVYLPLHYQPECNTSPVAEHFVDQILMVKILSAALPDGWVIYVKEHIAQWNHHNALPHLFRYNGYYGEMADLKNVRLIDPSISSYDLIAKSQATATASGTAGWEALARGKPVLFFGYPWYRHCDGALKISNVSSAKESFDRIVNGYKPDPQKVLNYLLALEKTTIEASHVEYMERVSGIPRKKSVENIATAIYEHVKNN